MNGFGYFQAELDARRMEHARATERATLAARLGPLPERPLRLAGLRAVLARLTRRGTKRAATSPAGTRCGSMYAPGSRRCLACGAGGRRTRGNWRCESRCVRRRRAWSKGRQPA